MSATVVADPWPDSQSLPAHAALLFRQRTVQVILAAVLVTAAVRVGMGRWSVADVAGPLVILAFEPLTEWMIHVFLLHFRPKRIAGRTVDPLAARKHRAHHQDPRNLELVLVPWRVVATALPVAAMAALVLGRGSPSAITTLLAAYVMLLSYEWTHFLIHSKYRPRHAYYRLLWRHHRNHHFRNEHYWFGVTMDLGDRLLRTKPAKDAVAVSPTAKDLAAGWD